MVLTPLQSEIAKDRHRFRVLCVGRRGGKTTLAIEEIKGKAIGKVSRIAYIAPTYQQARDIAWEQIKKELLPAIISINESRLEIKVRTIKVEESLIVLRGWESIETLRGQAFDFLVIDEVAMMRNFWSGWQEVLRPTLTDRRGEALFISTPLGFNHFYDLYNLQYEDESFASFHFTTYDNSHIPADEIEEAKKQLTEDRFAQEYLADFRKTEGLVYKEFNREIHVFDPEKLDEVSTSMLSEPKYVISGIDFGFTNPAAVLTIKIDGSDTWWITDEFYKTGKTDTQVAEYAAAQGFNYVFPDPENPSAIKELENKGVNVREVIKGKGSVEAGINKVREMLKAKKLKISKKCINAISEFESYCYPDSKNGERNESEAPIDAMNHALDALRYCAMMFYGNQVRETASVYKPRIGPQDSPQNPRAKIFKPRGW